MNAQEQEVAEEYDRRLEEICDQYEEAVKAPIEAFQAASEQKNKACKELDAWYAANYSGPKGGEWEVKL